MNQLEQYLERSQEIIGERTKDEEKYDNEVVKWLRKTGNIKKSIKKANRKFPSEAIKYDETNIDDIYSHYHYLMEHEEIIRKLKSMGH